MAWITFTSVSVSNGGLTATVNSSEDISLLEINAGLIIGELAPVAIKKAYLGAGNSKVIELFAPWPHATQTNKAARVFNTDAGLPEATKALNDVTDLVKGDFSEVIVVADNIDKVVNVSDNMSAVIAAPAEAAKAKTEADRAATNALSMTSMSQSQFEAIRAANNEEFAASGPVHLGKHESGKEVNPTKSGLYTALTTPNTLKLGKAGGVGGSKTDLSQLNIAGIQFYLDERSIKFPQAPDGKTTYNKSTGAIVTHADSTTAFAAQQADPTNVEVVIDRVDMWGFESWLEEVNATNPFVYPNGLIQSQATTMDGITTSASARPVTYYAVFEGDTGSKGKGVNFFTLTDAQKKKVLGNHKNNLYYLEDGRLVQWRLRQRTIAGAGNGDWGGIVCNAVDALGYTGYLGFSAGKSRVVPQGLLNAEPNLPYGYPVYAGSLGHEKTKYSHLGVFNAVSDTATPHQHAGINGECYFFVCGTMNRLNSGFYHPSLNANGSAKALGDTFWYNTAQSFTTTADCFNTAKLLAGSGSIASGKSGRPSGENQYYDAIYASGFGGVCRDMRYSANGLTPTDFADADQRVKNGTYRGFELDTRTTSAGVTTNGISSIGGSFLVTEVIGTTAALNATPSLAGGWQGRKNPLSPTGAISVFPLTRKALATPTALRSTNNGTSWTAFTPTFDAVKNEVTLTNEPATNIVILQYQAFAKQTKPSANAVVYGGQSGVGDVYMSSRASNNIEGVLLAEACLGKVLTDNTAWNTNRSLAVTDVRIGDKLVNDFIWHTTPNGLLAPLNNSPLFKALNYNVASNQQGFINYAYTELKHNGTNWGDDGKVTIVDNQSTKTDLNGNTVLVGTAQICEPLGFLKNKL